MAASRSGTGAGTREGLIEIAIGVAWLVGLAAAVRIVDVLLGKNPLAAAIAGAFIADFAAGRAGVMWDDRPDGSDNASRGSSKRRPSSHGSPADAAGSYAAFVAQRVGIGAAAGALIVVVTVLAGLALGWGHLSAGMPSTTLALAALQAAAIGTRDELLYRGIVLAAAARAKVAAPIAAVYAALAGGAAIAFVPESSPAAVILACASGWFFAMLWQRGRCAWVAVAAHATWVFTAGPLLRGGLLDMAWASGSLSLGARAAGAPALGAAAVCVGIVLGGGRLQRRRRVSEKAAD